MLPLERVALALLAETELDGEMIDQLRWTETMVPLKLTDEPTET